MRSHLRVVTRGNDRPESGPRFSASPNKEGSGAPNGAGTAPVTRYSRDPLRDRSPFGAPLRIDRTFVLPRPGPALPGITGYKREFCTPSPMPVQRAPRSPDTRRTGMMPRPSATEVTSPAAETAPAPSIGVFRIDVPHDERAATYILFSDYKVNILETIIFTIYLCFGSPPTISGA
jgi:hypothetical protein